MAEHIEEAAAAAQSSGASSDTEHVPYVENIERRARILAFMYAFSYFGWYFIRH
jgi:hypothetical protein